MDGKGIEGYLYSLRGRGAKLGLGRVGKLLEALGNPQDGFMSIVVGGTSGKGSTVAMLSSILSEAGYRTGRFTSPHLSTLTERIAIDGKETTVEELGGTIDRIRAAIDGMAGEDGFEHPTFFEVLTAAALLFFREREVDFAVLEVGLGGRLDATNAFPHILSVITNVSLEHTKILGGTIAEIAREKGGIIAENGILVTCAEGEAFDVLRRICGQRGCRLVDAGREVAIRQLGVHGTSQAFNARMGGRDFGELRLPLLGRHQLSNAACALGAISKLSAMGYDISDEAVRKGLERTVWPGRMEIMQENPLVVLDSAKDPAAMRKLRDALGECFGYGRLILVLGISSDKDIGAMAEAIMPEAHVVIATAHKAMGRAADPRLVADHARRLSKDCETVPDVKDAVRRAISLSGEGDMVLVAGSLFTVAEARELWGKGSSFGRELNEVPQK